ncbi:hypothetical protein [Nocardia sp. NBC_00416]|uniref:hypothetical protein n=1 Tax=Nocardia sp. NBC_00416 TaxID=2975991 RepID=UPI002E204C4B
MGYTRRSRRPGAAAVAVDRLGTLLAEGLLRNEFLVAAVVLSSITAVLGLTSDGVVWKVLYCAAGFAGIAATFVVMRKNWPLQWLASVGISVGNLILLVVYGRMSGNF